MFRVRLQKLITTLGIVFLPMPSLTQAAALLYVTNGEENKVTVVNIDTNQSAGVSIPVGNKPRGIAISGTGAYVANEWANTVSVIDVANNTVEATIDVEEGPTRIAISGTGVYVTNSNGNKVTVIDKTDNQVVTTIAVEMYPTGIAIQGTGAYVTNHDSDSVSVIDITDNQVAATISVGDQPIAVAIDGTGAYVVNQGSDNVSVIDITDNQVVATISVGDSPSTIAMSGTGGFVGNAGGESLTVFDTTDNQVVKTVATGFDTMIMGINGTGAYLKAGEIAYLSVFDIANNAIETTFMTDAELSGYGAFYSDTTTLAPTLTAPTTGSSVQLCDDLTVTYSLPETPKAGTVKLTFFNSDTSTTTTATLTNSTGATFALDLENFTGVANVASSTANSIVAGSYVVTLEYQDLFGNAVADDTANLTVTACASSSSSSSSTEVIGSGGGGGRRGSPGRGGIALSLEQWKSVQTGTVHTAAPEVPNEQSSSNFERRTCVRVLKWFANYEKMLERVNERLWRRFEFTCQ